ncbi:hypothetical protein HD806DRAFT_524650 [Xylariaceae sp. AK1471]|nr:hypothetical protein HD806DRAFT_524650 [Xylariaceae sp. AK1471]
MASPILKVQAAEPKSHYGDGLQHTPDYLPSPTPYGLGRDDKQKQIDTDPSHLRHLSFSPFSQDGRMSPISPQGLFPPPTITLISPHGAVPTPTGIRGFFASQWRKHKAPIYVFVAQLFGALMNLSARLLELGEVDRKLHPMQLLFCRMVLTVLACTLYIIKRRIPHGVLGSPEVRWLLVARGIAGFFGIYGMWYSMKYLPLAEATVITFLAPNLAGYWCHLFLRDPYTRTEQFASLLALGGVVLITKPSSLFSGSIQEEGVVETALAALANATMIATRGSDATESAIVDPHMPTRAERLGAIGVALLGVLGGSFAFTTLRAIGKRAHPLMSVNYFSSVCVIVTFSVLSLAPFLGIGQPDLRLGLPSSIRQWGLLLFLTACGLAMQVLITKGLAAERSNRATAMTYTHMLFAAGFDRFIWGTTMGWMSAAGCTMIVTGAVWVAVGKKGATAGKEEEGGRDVERAVAAGAQGEEAVPMLREELEDEGDDVNLERMR